MTGARCIRLIRRLSWLASRPAAPLPESCFKGADALRYRAARSRCVGQCVQHDESWIVPLYRVEVTRTPASDNRRA